MSTTATSIYWSIPEIDRPAVLRLSKDLDMPPIVCTLMLGRGISTTDEARRFLKPLEVSLGDPFTLTDIEAAVSRIRRARDGQEKILIFGDYDVDGISATALLHRCLNRYGIEDCRCAMPNRLQEGYGLNPDAVKRAGDEGISLIITVDNGISALEAARAANECGIDLIVTDHHRIEEDLPEACAVINPKTENPYAESCGVAVAFALASALTGERHDLDLVALGTVADIMPLTGQNRSLVALGLQEMRDNPKPGIAALCRKARVNPDSVVAENIAFHLGPRINAAGRIGDAMTSLRLLLTDSPQDAAEIARELDCLNQERRQIENGILADAEKQLESGLEDDQRTIVLESRGWHPGVIGIVASKLQQKYGRPVALIALNDEGIGRASARSTPDFDLMSGLAPCKELLERFGGHAAAAGMTIREENIPAFQEAFEAKARELITADKPRRSLNIDTFISFAEIDGRLLRAIKELEPF